jgi:hypothetical protein
LKSLDKLIQRLIPECQKSIYMRLKQNPTVSQEKLELVRQPISFKIVSYDTYIHIPFTDLAEIRFTDKPNIIFYFDGLTVDLWGWEAPLRALIEHEILHLPTRYTLPSGPMFERVPVYVPKLNMWEDHTQPIWFAMLDVAADKYMLPRNLQYYYHSILPHQFIVYEYLTRRERQGLPSIKPTRQKVDAYLQGDLISLEFVYPWISLIRHLYMWTVSKHHELEFPILDTIFLYWIKHRKKIVLALTQLYKKVLLQRTWRNQYIAETEKIKEAVREFKYAETDMSISFSIN